MAKLPEKRPTDTHGGAIFTSGVIIPPSKVRDNLSSYNIVDLPEKLKKVFYKYDCDMVPFFENWYHWCSRSLRQFRLSLGTSTITRITFSANTLYNAGERS